MKGSERRGIWDKIGANLNTNATEVHNYFHNTWAKQFYDDITPYKQEIAWLINQHLHEGLHDPRRIV